ncbi:hypothetical protein H6501_00030 [Candidatus Woesearchaeota archaeon]|nr:hypothetical protein [Candidatus Woesearchaeota archaeon]USN44505.1 MAG: hypothetical protein H6500_01500 [Candidatus Woesearchaeota archaeon]
MTTTEKTLTLSSYVGEEYPRLEERENFPLQVLGKYGRRAILGVGVLSLAMVAGAFGTVAINYYRGMPQEKLEAHLGSLGAIVPPYSLGANLGESVFYPKKEDRGSTIYPFREEGKF